MLHLLSERLAALADEEPTAAEAMHLASCSQCANTRRLHQHLFVAARSKGDQGEAPLTDWHTLAPRLAAEGLIAAPGASRFAARTLRRVASVAAALALLAGGTVAGRISAGATVVPARLLGRTAPASDTAPASFASTAEALDVFFTAQRDYERAAAYLSANDQAPRESQTAYINRLIALDDMNTASLAALRQSPTDPVLNGYYLSTASARNAARQKISQMIPVGAQVKVF